MLASPCYHLTESYVAGSGESPDGTVTRPMLNSVRRGIEKSIIDYLKSEGPQTWKARFWKKMVKWGETASTGLPPSAIVTAIIVAILLLSWIYKILSCVPGP
jgi:hypothetical protein